MGLKTSLAQIPSDLVISPDPLQFSDTALVSLDVSSPFNDVWLIDITINGVSYRNLKTAVVKIHHVANGMILDDTVSISS